MKNPLASSILATTCALAITSMATPEDKPAAENPWRDIAAGSQSGVEKPERLAIQTPEAWQAWWKEHTKNEFDPAKPNEPPKVDFDKETVLVATLGMRNTGGFDIRFAHVRNDGGTLKVVVKTTSPGPDSMVTMALTQPFAVIAVPKHDGKIEFTDG